MSLRLGLTTRDEQGNALLRPGTTSDDPVVRREKVIGDMGDQAGWQVMINDEDQYLIWPVKWDTPRGWRETGKAGTYAECLAHVEAVWTDFRPRSLREPAGKPMTSSSADT
jgi:MbtH protein